ncbi:MAG: rhomboid family intramembrane serine protease [Saprospiraceae bacterium]|nr:rhomboid family intramembrane serine protease [Saprospiraceae bacterium]
MRNFDISPVVKHLLFLNIIVFLASQVLDIGDLALFYPSSEYFRSFQIATYFFMHASLGHIFFNMFSLVMFGTMLERRWGPQRFLFYYIFTALGAAVVHMAVIYFKVTQLEDLANAFAHAPSYDSFSQFFGKIKVQAFTVEYQEALEKIGAMLYNGDTSVAQKVSGDMLQIIEFEKNSSIVGASGAIFGLLLAFGVIYPEWELFFMFIPVPIKAKYFIPVMLLMELFLGQQNFEWDNVAHYAHLGGALFGLLLLLFWRKRGEKL